MVEPGIKHYPKLCFPCTSSPSESILGLRQHGARSVWNFLLRVHGVIWERSEWRKAERAKGMEKVQTPKFNRTSKGPSRRNSPLKKSYSPACFKELPWPVILPVERGEDAVGWGHTSPGKWQWFLLSWQTQLSLSTFWVASRDHTPGTRHSHSNSRDVYI